MQKSALFLFSILLSHSALANGIKSPANTTSDPSSKTEASSDGPDDNHGLGLGIAVGSTSGIHAYYDLNLSQSSIGMHQVHVSVFTGDSEATSILESSKVKLSETRAQVSYRYVLRQGFFLGAGVGVVSGALDYSYNDLFFGNGNISREYSYTSGIVAADIGWQGKDGYYFTVNLQPAAMVGFSGDYEEADVPDVSNHRETASKFWKKAETQASSISVGFGYYLK